MKEDQISRISYLLLPPLLLQPADLLRRELDRGRLAAEELLPARRFCKAEVTCDLPSELKQTFHQGKESFYSVR